MRQRRCNPLNEASGSAGRRSEGTPPVKTYRSTRREFLDAAGVAAATTHVAPYVKTPHSAGRLSLLLFDHWVPGVNEVMRRLIEAWGRANHVEVEVDFNNQNIHVMAAE